MKILTKPIRLSQDEDSLLRRIYIRIKVPRDQFKRRPEELALLVETWHKLSGRDDAGPELVRYMQNQQKAKRRLPVPWPTFEGTHKRAPSMLGMLSDDQMTALREAYTTVVLPHDIGTDAVFWNDEILEELEGEFTRLSGTIIPGTFLMAIAEDKRKRGLWFTVGRSGHGFGDLGELKKVDESDE